MRKLLLFPFPFIFSSLTTQSQTGKEKKMQKVLQNQQVIYFATGGLTDNGESIIHAG